VQLDIRNFSVKELYIMWLTKSAGTLNNFNHRIVAHWDQPPQGILYINTTVENPYKETGQFDKKQCMQALK